jgi:hypothetical protein
MFCQPSEDEAGSQSSCLSSVSYTTLLGTILAWATHEPVTYEAQDIPRVFASLASSQEPYDVWFREQVKDIHGVDFSQGLPGPLPEVFIDWQAK